MKIDSLRTDLENLNQDLARLTEKAALPLHRQTGESEQDSLFLYGIVGGKDVGKTTLINRLAGGRISIDTDILDEGTRKAVAYCHQADQAALERRFAGELSGRVDYSVHAREELRNVILVDFPDYDSRFLSHLEDVKRLARYLQGFLWVISPRKYGDYEFVNQLETIAQSHEYYFCLFNKVDQLEGRADLETVRQEVLGYLQRECEKRGVPPPNPQRLLMISALHPERYEFPILHEQVIRRHSPEEILKAKVKNLRAEFGKNLERLRAHYDLPGRIQEIERAMEFIQAEMQRQFGEAYFEAVKKRVLALDLVHHRINSGLFYQRIQHWPVLRTLFYPLAGVIAYFGGRFAPRVREPETAATPRDLLRFEGQSAPARLQNLWAEVEEQSPELAALAGDLGDWNARVEELFHRLITLYEERVIQSVLATLPPPGPAWKAAACLPLVWFPIIQPVLLRLMEWEGRWFSLAGIRECIAILIGLLGAGALLENLVFLVFFYLACLVILYARGARRVLWAGGEEWRDLWFGDFVQELTLAMMRPLEEIQSRWAEKQLQLNAIEKEIEEELARIENLPSRPFSPTRVE
ncbi:MAG: GTPase domain-containing protein [bacterium]